MNPTQKIEYITDHDTAIPSAPEKTPRFSRMRIFLSVFIITFLMGLIANYSRPAIYQTQATLLTSAPTAVDQRSLEADIQHVTIQQQKLLGFELLNETLTRLKKAPELSDLTLADVRQMLKVSPVADTNLLSMTASGAEPKVLPKVINTWIDVYLDARKQSTADSSEQTLEQLRNELQQLEQQIHRKQQEIAQYRKQFKINSSERSENEHLAGLNALNEAYNQAKEEEIKAKARLDAVKQSIAAGQTVVPKQEQRSLSNLERRYQELKEKLAEFDKRYTRDYLALQPSLKFIPEQLKKLEKEIRYKRQVGQNIVLTEARQAYQAAKQVTANLRLQLDQQQKQAAEFTTVFSRHEQLQEDLRALEELYRETQVRLVKIESVQFDKYPQVEVIERASFNDTPIGPDYMLGNLIAFASALFLAFFSIWLVEFLTKKPTEQADKKYHFPVSVWFNPPPETDKLDSAEQAITIESARSTALPLKTQQYQPLSYEAVETLYQISNQDGRQAMLLLLSGLTLSEISQLRPDQVDIETAMIHIEGRAARSIPIGSRLLDSLAQTLKNQSIWRSQAHISEEDIQALLYCAFVDADIEKAGEDNTPADQLRQTYVIYLVQQGLRLNLLEKLVGPLTPIELASYTLFATEKKGKTLDEIDPIYPVCRADS
jgi:uncharacterized protein involved in exopolysaccharide biosynthesis